MPRFPVMQEAMIEEDFERMTHGLPVAQRPKEIRPDPVPPVVKNQIARSKINPDSVVSVRGPRKNVRNKEGVLFIGYDLAITDIDGKTLSGWVSEADLNWLRDNTRGRISLDEVSI